MNILMIGHNRSGKTSYMTALYKFLGDDPNGVGITTYDSNKKEQLKRLADNLSKGSYPTGTDIASEYHFYLTMNGSSIIPFDWYDYRGSALLESSTSQERERLLVKIDDADALIVFIDGDKLMDNFDSNDFEEEYDALLWIIRKATTSKKREQSKSYFPITLLITKADIHGEIDLLLSERMKSYFFPLAGDINKNPNAVSMVAFCYVTPNGVRNIYEPLIFSLFYGMTSYIGRREQELLDKMNEYNGHFHLNPFKDIKMIRECESELNRIKSLYNYQKGMGKAINKWKEQRQIFTPEINNLD